MRIMILILLLYLHYDKYIKSYQASSQPLSSYTQHLTASQVSIDTTHKLPKKIPTKVKKMPHRVTQDVLENGVLAVNERAKKDTERQYISYTAQGLEHEMAIESIQHAPWTQYEMDYLNSVPCGHLIYRQYMALLHPSNGLTRTTRSRKKV